MDVRNVGSREAVTMASLCCLALLVGCSFQAHSLPLSPYTHILDLEVKEA